jgi:hypothetical protein
LMAGMWELPEVAGSVVGAGETKVPRFARNDKQGRNDKRGRQDKTKRNDRGAAMYPELYFTVRHSITVTDYTVRVWRMAAPIGVAGQWVTVERLARIALTGLARKILRKAGIIASIREAHDII